MNRARLQPAVWPALVLALTIGQLAVATFVPGIERFEGKAFGARLVAYPVMMLVYTEDGPELIFMSRTEKFRDL